MAKMIVRGLRRGNKDFFLKDDLLVAIARFGESPRLNRDQRKVVDALLRFLRKVEYQEYEEDEETGR